MNGSQKTAKDKFTPLSDLGQRWQVYTIFLACVFLILALRIVHLQLYQPAREILEKIAQNQYSSKVQLAAYRGTIFDHLGNPLALSVKAPSLAVNPRVFKPNREELKKIGQTLNLPTAKIAIISKKNSYFAWLKRSVDPKAVKELEALAIPGLYSLVEPSRFYPYQKLAATLIGYVGRDNKGLLGIEHQFDSYLMGSSTKLVGIRDARGQNLLLNPELAMPEQAGNNIFLSIDRVIQEISEEALARGMEEAKAKQGFVIVSDPHSGRILALANHPTFNPNNQQDLNIQNTANLAATMLFEPGSVLKPLVIAKALDDHLTKTDEVHHCSKNGVLAIDAQTSIHDDHPKEFLSTEEVIIHSSNICTFQIAKRLGMEKLYKSLFEFGLGGKDPSLTQVGEVPGRIAHFSSWRPIRFANIAFGQGLLVNGLEIVRAFSVFANGGLLIHPYVIERIESESGEVLLEHSYQAPKRILSAKTATAIKGILSRVVTEGTAKQAKLDRYSSAGKTGTAEKIDPATKSYAADKRIANFIGMSPVRDPHLVIYVVIDEPQKKPYYGGKWAGPVFKEIAEKSLKYLNVASDQPEAGNELAALDRDESASIPR